MCVYFTQLSSVSVCFEGPVTGELFRGLFVTIVMLAFLCSQACNHVQVVCICISGTSLHVQALRGSSPALRSISVTSCQAACAGTSPQ